MTINELAEITKGEILNGDSKSPINRYHISPKDTAPKSFYLPIFNKEDRQAYILEEVNKGILGYMLSSHYEKREETIKKSKQINPEIIIIEVENINKAIYELGLAIRSKHIGIPIVAVTGSVGKSTVTNMIAQILSTEKNILADQKNNNNNTCPLLAWMMTNIENKEMAVLEAGIASKGVMEHISELVKPSICVIHNIGNAHLAGLENQETVRNEKMKLTKFMQNEKIVFLNADDPYLAKVELPSDYQLKRYSRQEAKNINIKEECIQYTIPIYGEETKITLHTYGKYQIINSIAAIRVAEMYRIQKENIVQGLANFQPIKRRFVVKTSKIGATLIDDTYNANPNSMKAGLQTANEMKSKRKIAVLGDMLELGETSDILHEEIGEFFSQIQFDELYTYGEKAKIIAQKASPYLPKNQVIMADSKEELIQQLQKETKEGDLIYVKASGKMKFSNIIKALSIEENKKEEIKK